MEKNTGSTMDAQWRLMREADKNVHFGAVSIIIRYGRVVLVDVTDKMRLTSVKGITAGGEGDEPLSARTTH